MGKKSKLIKKQGEEFMEKNRAALLSGQTIVISRLRVLRDDHCAHCKVKSINYGGTATLKRCAECELVCYCSRECQAQDWPDHKILCKDKKEQKKSVNADVMSVSQLMMNGFRLFCDGSARKVARFENVALQPALELFSPIVPVATMRVKVSSADRSYSIQVKALFSSAAQVSSISERLANRLGITRAGKIFVSGLRVYDVEAYLPSKSVDISCVDVVCADGVISAVPSFSRMALVIMTHPGNELVIGKDWLGDIIAQSGRELLLDFAPDKCRLHFLAAGQSVKEDGVLMDLSAYLHNPDVGNFVVSEWGRPDPGPAYSPGVGDFSHHIRPENSAWEQLDQVTNVPL